jgi:hypothetical protein
MEKRLIPRRKIDPKLVSVAVPENVTVYSPPDTGHSVYSLIGQVAMSWSRIEQALDSCIGILADIDGAITACITAQMMGHAPRCLTIKALAHWRGHPDIEKATEKLQQVLFGSAELRNRGIHDQLLVEKKTKGTLKNHRMSKKELHFGLKEFDDTELKQAIQLMDKHLGDCYKLLSLIRGQVYLHVP